MTAVGAPTLPGAPASPGAAAQGAVWGAVRGAVRRTLRAIARAWRWLHDDPPGAYPACPADIAGLTLAPPPHGEAPEPGRSADPRSRP